MNLRTREGILKTPKILHMRHVIVSTPPLSVQAFPWDFTSPSSSTLSPSSAAAAAASMGIPVPVDRHSPCPMRSPLASSAASPLASSPAAMASAGHPCRCRRCSIFSDLDDCEPKERNALIKFLKRYTVRLSLRQSVENTV